MRKTMVPALGLALALAVGMAAAANAETEKAHGTVKSVDAKTMMLVVETPTGAKTFKVDEKTPIVMASSKDKTMHLSDLKVGEMVRVHYSTQGTVMVASHVEVTPETAKITEKLTPRKPAAPKKTN